MKKLLLLSLFLIPTILLTGCLAQGKEMSYSGRVEATEVDLSSEVGGTITSISVTQGDKVAKGQLVVELDDGIANLNLQQAQLAVDANRSRLKDAQAGNRVQQIESAMANTSSAEVNLNQAEQELEFYSNKLNHYGVLLVEGAISQQIYDSIELSYKQAQSRLAILRSQWKQAQSQLELLQSGNTSHYLSMLKAELENAKVREAQARLQLEKHKLHAPTAGIVSLVNYEVGELVGPGSKILSTLNLDKQWVKIYIPQVEAGNWKIGEQVVIKADAYPEAVFVGEVSYIATEAEFTPQNVQTKEARMDTVFAVKIRFLSGLDQLRPGMWVEVSLGGTK